MSNTPKTDALIMKPFCDGNAARNAFIEFARNLETENNALRAELSLKKGRPSAHDLAELFLRWPLPDSVCADVCATWREPGRTGSNLLSYVEAKQMFEQLLGKSSE